MKITERRLRSIIRSVIKESRINEMMGDMHYFDAPSGASGHEKSNILRQEVNSWKDVNNVIRDIRGQREIEKTYGGKAVFITGLAAMALIGSTAMIAGAPLTAIAVGTTAAGAIKILLDTFKDRMDHTKMQQDMKNQIDMLQEEFFEACTLAGGPSKLFPGIKDEREAFRMFLQQSGLMSQDDINAYVPARSF